MHSLTYYVYQVALFATTGFKNTIKRDDNIVDATSDIIERNGDIEDATSAGRDWIAITAIVFLAGFICYQLQFYEPETGQFQHHAPPLARATTGIARRVGADLVRFVLNVLAMIAELLLEAWNGSWYTLFRIGRGFRYIITALEPVATRIWRYYDSAKHSHYANLSRQQCRSVQAISAALLPRAIAIGAVLHFFVVPAVMSSIFLDRYPIYPYQAPAWVIKARPENRPYEGSSSHYRPARDCIDVQGIGEVDVSVHLLTDLEMVGTSQELQVQPQTITRTVLSMTRGPETGSAGD